MFRFLVKDCCRLPLYTPKCDLVFNPDLCFSTSSVQRNSLLAAPLICVALKNGAYNLSPCVVPDTLPRDFIHTVTNGVPDVRFKWSPPPQRPATGAITHYTVTCASTSGEETWTSSALELTISTLTPGTHYTCAVSASTAAGEGPHSDPIQVLTSELDNSMYDVISRSKCNF